MSSQADDGHWAVIEFADAELGDVRRTKRLVELASVLAQHPPAALPEACGDAAMLKAAYRFFENDAIEPQDVLLSHIEATYGRLSQVPVVLAVQDTTEGNWTTHPATKGLGPLGHSACQGLLVHSTLAFPPERVPLGLVAQQVWARAPDDIGKRARRKQLPISQKESQKWLASLDAVFSAREACPQTCFVSIGDREADIYDLLAAPRRRVSSCCFGRRGTAVSAHHSAMCGPPWPPNPWWSSSACRCRGGAYSPPGKPSWRCGFVA